LGFDRNFFFSNAFLDDASHAPRHESPAPFIVAVKFQFLAAAVAFFFGQQLPRQPLDLP